MAYTNTLLADEQDDVLMMNPDPEAAEFDDEGSGATSGYGDLTEDDLSLGEDAEDIEDPLEIDPDDELQGDDIDEDDL